MLQLLTIAFGSKSPIETAPIIISKYHHALMLAHAKRPLTNSGSGANIKNAMWFFLVYGGKIESANHPSHNFVEKEKPLQLCL
jgi:hypothetical protein